MKPSWAVSPIDGLIYAPAPAPAPGRSSPTPTTAALLDATTGDRLVTTAEAAAVLGLSPRTMEGMRRRGDGPAFVVLSRNAVRYRQGVLRAWIDSRSAAHTAKARAVLRAA